MGYRDRPSRVRSLLVWLCITAGVLALAWSLLPLDVTLQGSFDELLVRLCSGALLACGAWFWVASTAVVASVLTARTGAEPLRLRGVPAPVRRLVLLLCGVALTGGIATPALATPGPAPLDGQDHSGRVVLTGLPFPDRATKAQAAEHPRDAAMPGDSAAGHRGPKPARRVVRSVVVRHGDSLWSIAADRLPANAGNAEVAAAWQDLYALNRDVIGSDPDRIEPGQLLVLPAHLALHPEGAPS